MSSHVHTGKKMLRCSGETQDTCEECFGEKDCFSDCADSKCVELTSENFAQGMRFILVTHVRCGMGNADMSFNLGQLKKGRLAAYWDGKPVTDNEFTTCGAIELPAYSASNFQLGSSSKFAVLLETGDKQGTGGHVFEVEFTPDNADSRLKVNSLQFFMDDRFAKCVDTKSCVGMFAMHKDGGMLLRNSNGLQQECLESQCWQQGEADQAACLRDEFAVMTVLDPVPSATVLEQALQACIDWRGCLVQSDERRDEHIQALIGATGGAEISQAAATESTQHSDGMPNSIYPPTEDPESWDCDCWADMHTRCNAVSEQITGYQLDLCLRAQYCMHPRISTAWRDAVACDGTEMMTYRNKITNSMQGALLERASAAGKADTVESMLSNKHCV